MEKIIIAGSGPAGLTAAIYAARSGLEPLVLEGMQPGGQLTQTEVVENFPGFPDGIDANELMARMKRQAERFGARFQMDEMTGVARTETGVAVDCMVGGRVETVALIVATGATARKLGLESEAKLTGRGVSGCAVCDGAFYKGKAVAVIGDSTFMHSGMTGLVNVAYNGSNSTVIILDNSITGMTGHQQNPTTGYNLKGDPAAKVDLVALCHAIGIRRVRVVDPYDLAACETAVREELASAEPSVIISRRPCALLKYVKHKPPLVVDQDQCKSCKLCMKIGCPAISMTDGKAEIDATLCTGCGVCAQLCRFGALCANKEA